jgi:putative SOS response-associated peptidase YedK
MCGRFSNSAAFSQIKVELKLEQLEFFREWQPAYNISPSYGPGHEQLIVTRTREGRRAVRLARWWLIPRFWNKSLKALPASFNARSDEIENKPFWRDAFRSSRCLVPATGWREFAGKPGTKQPYHFHFGHRPFAFAGLWSTWIAGSGEVVDSFAIVTTAASGAAAAVHDRMPLVLPAESHDAWLDPAAEPAHVLASASAAKLDVPLEIFPSNPLGNSSGFEGPEAIAPIVLRASKPKPVQQSFGWAEQGARSVSRRR